MTCGEESFERQTYEGSAEFFNETLDAVNGASSEGGEEDDVSEIFAQVHRWEAARLSVTDGVDEAEGDVGESEPAKICDAGCGNVLAGE